MTNKEWFDFAEWIAMNYEYVGTFWCRRNSDKTDKNNWKTAKELFREYRKLKSYNESSI